MLFEGFETIRRFFLFIFIALVVAFISIAFLMKIEEYGRKTPDSIEIKNSRIRIIKNGKVKWEFRAKKIVMSPDEKSYSFEDIGNGAFYRSDKPPLTFKSGSGKYDSNEKILLLNGNTDMSSENGDFLHAGRIEWYGKTNKLTIPAAVSFGMEGNRLKGDSMEAWGEDLTTFSVRNNVSVEIPDLKKTGGRNTAKEMEEASIDDSYLKNLKLTARLVEYDRVAKAMKCFSNSDRYSIFMPGRYVPKNDARVILNGSNYTLKANEMFLDLEGKAAQATGRVWALKKAAKPEKDKSKVQRALAKKDTVFESEEANLFWKEGFLDFPYNVSMTRPDVTATAGRAFIDTKHNTAFLTFGVNMHQKKGDWLIDDGFIDKDASEKTKKAAREEATVTCADMDIDFNNDNLNAYGNVLVIQQKRQLYGGSAHYEGGNKTWAVFGDSFYSDEEHSIRADRFIYYEKEKIFEALDGVTAEAKPDGDQRKDMGDYFEERDGQPPEEKTFERERIKVTAPKLHYNEGKDTLYAEQGARLVFHDVVLLADKIFVDYGANNARGEGNVRFDDKRNHITSEKFFIDWKEKRVEMKGDVRLKDSGRPPNDDIEEQEPTELQANSLIYEWKNKKGTAQENVTIASEGRSAVSDKIAFDRERKSYNLTGNVKIHQENGDWLEKRDVFDKDDDKARRLAKKPTDITCAEALFDDDRKLTVLGGDVHIVQKHVDIKSKTVLINTKRKVFEAEGDVRYEQDQGDWLFEEKFIDKEDLDEDLEKKIRGRLQASADRLVSQYGEDIIYIEGNVKFTQGKNSATAEKLWHYGDTKRTVLEGKVAIVDDRGRDFTAERVIYDRTAKTVEAFTSVKGSTDLKELEKKKNM